MTDSERLAAIRAKLREIVCVEGCDKGIVMLDVQGTTHEEEVEQDGKMVKCVVYDHQYFSPLGDALIELYDMTGEWYEP